MYTARAEEPENPFGNKQILVFTPTWSEPDSVLPFLQEKVEELLLESPGKFGWNFEQVGYIPLFLRVHIKKSENNFIFVFTVTYRDGRELFVLEDTCDICNTSEALEKLGEMKDEACARLEEAAKKAAEEHKTQPRPVASDKKIETPVLLKLGEPEPFVMPPWKLHPPPVRLWTWMGASLSAVSLVTGIVLLGMNREPTCDAPFPDRQCPERYSTGTAGWTFLLVGLAGGGFSGWNLYKMYFRSPSVTPTVTPMAGSGATGLILEWNF